VKKSGKAVLASDKKTVKKPSRPKHKPSLGARAMPGAPVLAAFETSLGHSFENRDLLLEALTHASVDTGAQERRHALRVNERLEFLGDRVLGLLAAEALICAFPDAPEGDLAPRLNALVRKETCAEVALECGIDRAIVLAESEDQSGGRAKQAILGDACEALMAALYLDGGLQVAAGFFDRYWLPKLAAQGSVPQDPKTRLQEWAQGKWQLTPVYTVIDRSGPDHEPVFKIEVVVGKLAAATGIGASKRHAEQAAAQAIWERENPGET
jgi:ribonuclease-3